MARFIWLPALLLAVACASLSPAGSRVEVFRAKLDALPAQRAMPAGCRLVSAKPKKWMTELELDGSKDPFRVQRNEAGAAGANALLVLTHQIRSRRAFECPAALPITDCPGNSGGEFDVVFESYLCPPDAMKSLAAKPAEAFSETKPITIYTATPDVKGPQQPKQPTTAKIAAYVFVTTSQARDVVEALRRLPGVVRADALFGEPDVVAIVEANDIPSVDALVERIAHLPGVSGTKSHVIRSTE